MHSIFTHNNAKSTTFWGHQGRDRMVVGCTITYAIGANHHWSCEFESCSWRCILDTTICDKVCQWLVTCQWFSLWPPVFSTNKTDRHDIAEILLKVAFNTLTQTLLIINMHPFFWKYWCSVVFSVSSIFFYLILNMQVMQQSISLPLLLNLTSML